MSDLIVPFDGFAYHTHQAEAIAWMTARESETAQYVRGGILADEMGLGKTWMTIGLILNSPVASTLLLVPPVLLPQWAEVLTKSGIPHRILGAPAKTVKGATFRVIAGRREMSVTLSTYCRATQQIETLGAYDRIVCDEGHVFRNGPKTKTFVQLDKIPAERRWILSGTPVQNRASDLRNLLRFLHIAMADLTRDIKPIASVVILRRTVEDIRDSVTSMPALKPTHEVIPVTMPSGSEEQTLFHALLGRFELAIEMKVSEMNILELYLRIRQFAAHPNIYVDAMRRKFGSAYTRGPWMGTASKMEAFRNFLVTRPPEPTIVFTSFKGEIEVAESHLRTAGYETWCIRGGMTENQRSRVITESAALAAEAGAKPVAILIQIVAGGAGLNLQHCSRVCFLSSHWNPAVVDQAIARAYRMGQSKQVKVVHFLIAELALNNIDRLMAERHGIKRTIATEIHPKLYCDSAVSIDQVSSSLDSAVEHVVSVEAGSD